MDNTKFLKQLGSDELLKLGIKLGLKVQDKKYGKGTDVTLHSAPDGRVVCHSYDEGYGSMEDYYRQYIEFNDHEVFSGVKNGNKILANYMSVKFPEYKTAHAAYLLAKAKQLQTALNRKTREEQNLINALENEAMKWLSVEDEASTTL